MPGPAPGTLTLTDTRIVLKPLYPGRTSNLPIVRSRAEVMSLPRATALRMSLPPETYALRRESV